ncbi:antibiotic biosynthesis monooxygenase [Streptomyces sp. NPDC002564]|uniref:antibiotic biosynthesis monooxygenase n=1 Tax=Streptomyces sp. NPDC002564 TaxID=3364649 RepID=UPI003696E5A5
MPENTTAPGAPTRSTGAPPDPALAADGGLTFISTWSTGSPARQRATLDAIAEAWRSRPWPHAGLLSYAVHAGADGSTVLHHSQWRDEGSYQEFFAGAANGRDARNDDIDAAVPGIARLGLNKTRLYRSWTDGRERAGREPGAVVIVRADVEGPGPDRGRAWADAVIDALDDDGPQDGAPLSAHFHLSTDGTRVLLYAQWESGQAHADALAAPGDGIVPPTPPWRRVRDFPGVLRDDAVARYRFAYGFVPSTA